MVGRFKFIRRFTLFWLSLRLTLKLYLPWFQVLLYAMEELKLLSKLRNALSGTYLLYCVLPALTFAEKVVPGRAFVSEAWLHVRKYVLLTVNSCFDKPNVFKSFVRCALSVKLPRYL